jgi:hypothetical protein
MNFKKEYKPLTDELFTMQEEIYKDYGMEPKPGLGNMWAILIIQGPITNNIFILTLNGRVFIMSKFLKIQEDYLLKIQDQDLILYLPRRLKGIPRALWRVVIYPAIEGQMIMFPAWLPHGVEINESKEKGEKGWRVSVSFNFIQVNKEGKVG